jgi:hypothetical protein
VWLVKEVDDSAARESAKGRVVASTAEENGGGFDIGLEESEISGEFAPGVSVAFELDDVCHACVFGRMKGGGRMSFCDRQIEDS